MNTALLRTLIEHKIVRPTTEVECRFKGVSLDGSPRHEFTGSFYIVSIRNDEEGVTFEGASTRDGARYRLEGEHVLTIDGMEPARLASIHNIREDGGAMKPKARRGRKPKHLRETIGF